MPLKEASTPFFIGSPTSIENSDLIEKQRMFIESANNKLKEVK
jgi:hypothetical protein